MGPKKTLSESRRLHLTKSYRGRTCRPDSTERRKSIIQQGVKQQTQKKILPSTLDPRQKDRLPLLGSTNLSVSE